MFYYERQTINRQCCQLVPGVENQQGEDTEDAILVRVIQEGLFEEITFEQKSE